ncbi:hypothetical protein PaG_05657 [Moesziomyces aphidis]|uniref:Ribosomal protein L17 n=1 Tax=Moesziomyces aphidis TaxID=84754 RepID=W3VG05_MOEAP|nr:hypothetical protein PaG_05657 [Moesziomyces aphidis]
MFRSARTVDTSTTADKQRPASAPIVPAFASASADVTPPTRIRLLSKRQVVHPAIGIPTYIDRRWASTFLATPTWLHRGVLSTACMPASSSCFSSPAHVHSKVRYAFDDSKLVEKTAKSRGEYLRVHFKNTRETAAAVNGLKLQKAYAYLGNVVEKKQCIPFRRFNGGVGRTQQAKEFKTTQVVWDCSAMADSRRWPVKSVKFLLALLKNAESNAEAKGLDTEELVIRNIVIQQAPKTRRRTYRAHGRINPYEGHPIHAEILLAEPAAQVPKAASSDLTVRLNKRQLAQKRITAARATKA